MKDDVLRMELAIWRGYDPLNSRLANYNLLMKISTVPPPLPPPTPPTPSFPQSDPAAPDFWNHRFEAAFTPWDQGGVPVSLSEHLQRPQALQAGPETQPIRPSQTKTQRVLIPGCGSGYEVKYLADLGYAVTAIDFSPAAVAQAQRILGKAYADLVREEDFFGATLGSERFDIIYERAFLCALPRRMWLQWATRVAELIPTGGRLIGFLFADNNEKGPPFGLATGELEKMLEPHFTRTARLNPPDSIAVFAGKETWQVWVRNESG